MSIVMTWLVHAAALIGVAYLIPAIHVNGFVWALIAALVIGLLNTFVRPVLKLFALPITLLTLGLFSLVINAGLFWLAGALLDGFAVEGFVAALLGSLAYSIASRLLESLFVKED